MAKRLEALLSVTGAEFETRELDEAEREALLPIIDESFHGLYRWHAKRTLRGVEAVRAARSPQGEYAGLIMLKTLGDGSGYVYYVAVLPGYRGRGLGGKLLDEAIERFSEKGVSEVYASVEEDNKESKALFASRGFRTLDDSYMQQKYGRIKAFMLHREMTLVPGERLMALRLKPNGNPG